MLAVAIVALACRVEAALVTFRLVVDENSAGSFNLYASSSPGDNFGLAFYSVRLSGGIISLDHISPQATDLASGTSVGFRTLRSADHDALLLVEAAQDTISPSPFLVRSLGQSHGSLSTLPGITQLVNPEQSNYANPLLLASGHYVGPSSAIGFAGTALANVFRASTGSGTLPATATTQTTRLCTCLAAGGSRYASSALMESPFETVPEPYSWLSGMAVLWIIFHVRRHSHQARRVLQIVRRDLTDNDSAVGKSGSILSTC